MENINEGAFKKVSLNIIFIGTSLFVDFLNCSIKSEKNISIVKRVNTIRNE